MQKPTSQRRMNSTNAGETHGQAAASDQPVGFRGAICLGVGVRYLARVRPEGYRRYQVLGKPTKSYRVAVRRMAKAFVSGHYKRGDVIMSITTPLDYASWCSDDGKAGLREVRRNDEGAHLWQ